MGRERERKKEALPTYFFFDAATAAHASLLQLMLLGIIARRGGVAVSERSRRSSERSLRRNS
jgi:hypothetical protein